MTKKFIFWLILNNDHAVVIGKTSKEAIHLANLMDTEQRNWSIATISVQAEVKKRTSMVLAMDGRNG